MNIPTAEELRKKIAVAKERNMEPVKVVAKKIVAKFAKHIETLLADPSRYTSHTLFSVEMPVEAYANHRAEECLFRTVRELIPSDYVVEKSHDGGGMYSVVVIRWNLPPTMRARVARHG
jgi:hypothetical protein